MYQTKKKIVYSTSIFRQNQEYSHNADRILSDRKQHYVNNLDKLERKVELTVLKIVNLLERKIKFISLIM